MQKNQFIADNFDISGIHSCERTLILDLSTIQQKDDCPDKLEDDVLLQQLAVLQTLPDSEQPLNQHLEQARNLKRKVIKTLENYSSLISKRDPCVKELIPRDLSLIEYEYEQLSKCADSIQNKEVQAITKLVGEFIAKMSIRSQQKAKTQPPVTNSYSDESTSLPNKTLGAINNKIKELISKVNPEHKKIIALSTTILNNSDTVDTFKLLRNESKTHSDPTINKLVKACYLKGILQSEQSNNSSGKREFYDLVIKLKSQVPPDHEVHQFLISSLYEDLIQQGVPSSEWEQYMKKKLSL